MPITLHIEAESHPELISKTLAALGMTTAEQITAPLAKEPKVVLKKVEPVSQGTAQSESPDSTLASGEPSPSTTGQTATSDASRSDAPLTYDADIKPAILRVNGHPEDQGGGRAGVEKLVKQFGGETPEGTNAKYIPEDQWPALLAAVDAVLGAA